MYREIIKFEDDMGKIIGYFLAICALSFFFTGNLIILAALTVVVSFVLWFVRHSWNVAGKLSRQEHAVEARYMPQDAKIEDTIISAEKQLVRKTKNNPEAHALAEEEMVVEEEERESDALVAEEAGKSITQLPNRKK